VEPLRDIIAQFLDRSGLTRHVQHDELRRVWQELLGDAAEHTRLEAVRKSVATFRVDSAALLHELNNFRKAELLGRLQSDVKGMFISDIKFRLGALTSRRT
jgi:predicted nucleic acid-binding Zn ribbon protein